MPKPSHGLRIPAWAAALAVALAAGAIFARATSYPFFPFWDDDIHVHSNPYLANLSWASLRAFWSAPYQQLYIPLTYSAWAALAALSRAAAGLPVSAGALNPAWFHAANVLAHSVSALLAFFFVRRTTEKFFPDAPANRLVLSAAAGALLFAIHPLQVEPVAWVSGLRDVLGGCLGLAALCVLFGERPPGLLRAAAATLLFAAGLAAKPAGVALPPIAALLAFAPYRWPWRRAALALAPWFALGAAWVFLTSNAQWAADLARDLVPGWARPLVAGDALAFYLHKTLWPANLAADYGRSPDAAMAAGWLWWTWAGPAAAAAVLAAAKPLRPYLVPFGIFALALSPVLGLVPFNFQVVSTVADRYAYFALVGAGLALSMAIAQARHVRLAAALAAAALLALGAISWQRLALWSEDLRLFADTLATNPQSWKAMHNYASALDDRGRTAEAEPWLRRVIALRPDSAEAHNDLGVILWKQGRSDDAVAMMRESLELRPTAGAARNLVQMEARRGNAAGVLLGLEALVQLDPSDRQAAQSLEALRAQMPRGR